MSIIIFIAQANWKFTQEARWHGESSTPVGTPGSAPAVAKGLLTRVESCQRTPRITA